MKKLSLVLGLSAVFVMLFSGVVNAAYYSDISKGDVFYDAVKFLTDEGVVSGFSNGTFGSDLPLTRAQLLKIIIEAKGVSLGNNNGCFSDVPNGSWYEKYACYAKNQGWVSGYSDGTFKPTKNVTFVEALKMLMEVYDVNYPNTTIWYEGVVDTAANDNIIPLTIKSFSQNLERGEMADMITRKMKNDAGKMDEYLGGKAVYKVDYDSIKGGKDLSYVEKLYQKKGCSYNGYTYDDGDSVTLNSCTTCVCDNGEVKNCTGLCEDEWPQVDFDNNYSKVWYDGNALKADFYLENKGVSLTDVDLRVVIQDDDQNVVGTFEETSYDLAAGHSRYFEDIPFDLTSMYKNKKVTGTVTIGLYINDGLVGNNGWSKVSGTSGGSYDGVSLTLSLVGVTVDSITIKIKGATLQTGDKYYVECIRVGAGEAENMSPPEAQSTSSTLTVMGLKSNTQYSCRGYIKSSSGSLNNGNVAGLYTDSMKITTDYSAEGDLLTYNLGSYTLKYYEGWDFYLTGYETVNETYIFNNEFYVRTVSTDDLQDYANTYTGYVSDFDSISVDGHSGYKFYSGEAYPTYNYLIEIDGNSAVYAWGYGSSFPDKYDEFIDRIEF